MATENNTPRRLFRSPYLWAFLVGIVTITALRPFMRHVPDPPPVLGQVPAFRLTDQRGLPFGSADLEGRVWVAGFFLTRCPRPCPELMEAMSRLGGRYGAAGMSDRVRLVSISVEPTADTPERVAEYAESLGADPARWSLLTGEPEAVRELLADGFRLAMEPPRTPDPERSTDPADDVHTAQFVLVDGLGQVRGYYEVLNRELYMGFEEGIDVAVDEVFHRSRHVLAESDR
jgi:protein SCO1/2